MGLGMYFYATITEIPNLYKISIFHNQGVQNTWLQSFFSLEESVFLSPLSKTQGLQWDIKERHKLLSSVYEDKQAGVSSCMIYMALEVIAWTTEIVVCKQINTCKYPFVLSAADH